jgi:hypothetical protein
MAVTRTDPDPLSIECPQCGAAPGGACATRKTSDWGTARTHTARWRAVGIERPSMYQLYRNSLMLKKHQTSAGA